MQERRKAKRSRVLKSARLFLDTWSVSDGQVRDLTSAGARVRLPNTLDLPEKLTMSFDGGRTMRSCRIVWRQPNETGLEFIRCEPAKG
jgi:methyl-accepting chemotaxis protein